MSCPDPKMINADINTSATFPQYKQKRQVIPNDIYQIYNRIQALMEKLQIERMPTEQEFIANGERTALIAILGHGGLRGIAARMDIPYALRKPRGYWRIFGNVEIEFRRFMVEQGLQSMPSEKHLEAADRLDLLMAAKRHGGLRAVASRMGVPANRVGRPRKIIT